MGEPLPRCVIMRDGRVIPVIGLLGPSGTGKTLLAIRSATMLTRARSGPNVLLVDSDVYARGLTTHIEHEVLVLCAGVHDVLYGRGGASVEPMDITQVSVFGYSDMRLPDEGRLYLFPAGQRYGVDPFTCVAKMALAELQEFLRSSITNAVRECDADCVVVDTASIPEPCAAAVVSFCDVVVMVGNSDKTDDYLQEHKKKVAEFGVAIDDAQLLTVFNQLDPIMDDRMSGPLPVRIYPLPAMVSMVGESNPNDEESVADYIDLDSRIVSMLLDTFRVDHRQLVPEWYAPLPAPWRLGARRSDTSAPSAGRLCVNRIVLTAVTGVAGIAILWLALAGWPGIGEVGTGQLLPWVMAVVGMGLAVLALSWALSVDLARDYKSYCALVSCLRQRNLRRILGHLRIPPLQVYRLTPRKRTRIRERKLERLRRAFQRVSRRSGSQETDQQVADPMIGVS